MGQSDWRLVPGTQHIFGAAHAQEIAYKFDLIQPHESGPHANSPNPAPPMMPDAEPDSAKAAHNMSEMWSTLARTGKPGAKEQPDWAAYDVTRRATMFINAECKVVDDTFTLERQVWEKLGP
jgi:para-nitrobenzyl esterase